MSWRGPCRRELAVKAKAHLKEAAVLFEQGAVKAWYVSNGWTYPIQGTEGKGRAPSSSFSRRSV